MAEWKDFENVSTNFDHMVEIKSGNGSTYLKWSNEYLEFSRPDNHDNIGTERLVIEINGEVAKINYFLEDDLSDSDENISREIDAEPYRKLVARLDRRKTWDIVEPVIDRLNQVTDHYGEQAY